MLLLADLERYVDRLAVACEVLDAGAHARYDNDRESDNSFTAVDSDAIIEVSGAIDYSYSIYSWLYGGTSYLGIQNSLNEALNAASVKRIVMVFDTPGGVVTGCQETARMIKQSAKPVVAVVTRECASAGLWLASQCKSITCMESGEIGSLGVQSIMRSFFRQIKENGVDINVIRAAISPDKNLGHPYEETSEEALADTQARVDKWGEMFLSTVAAGRGVSREVALEKFGKGKMMYADEALAAGLIDRIGTLEQVLSERESQPKRATNRYAATRYHEI
jgi:ClpP class serine protease